MLKGQAGSLCSLLRNMVEQKTQLCHVGQYPCEAL